MKERRGECNTRLAPNPGGGKGDGLNPPDFHPEGESMWGNLEKTLDGSEGEGKKNSAIAQNH